MRTATFTVTHARDVAWLPYLAYSITKFCRGFDEHVLVCDTDDVPVAAKALGSRAAMFSWKPVDPMQPGHLWQQVVKLYADQYTGADLIVNIDSDAIFCKSNTPESFMVDGKPYLLRRTWEAAGDAKVWRAGTERALGEPVSHEYMCRLGQMYRRDDVRAIREHLEKVQGKSAVEYIMGCGRPDGWWGYSDFNVMGAIVARNLAEHYAILTYGQDDARMPEPVVLQNNGATGHPTMWNYWERLAPVLGLEGPL